jgi:hypothetical protein
MLVLRHCGIVIGAHPVPGAIGRNKLSAVGTLTLTGTPHTFGRVMARNYVKPPPQHRSSTEGGGIFGVRGLPNQITLSLFSANVPLPASACRRRPSPV